MRAKAKSGQLLLVAAVGQLLLVSAAGLLAGGSALAAPASRAQAESSTLDREFRAAYPSSARPPGKPVAGVALAKLVLPGLQLAARSERTAGWY